MASEWRMKISLRVKKYLNEMSFLSSPMMGVGALFLRQADVDAETVFRPGAFVSGLHDAGAGAGDDHEAGGGDLFAELGGLHVFGLGRMRARGAEDGDFALVGIRREDAEGVAEFAQ